MVEKQFSVILFKPRDFSGFFRPARQLHPINHCFRDNYINCYTIMNIYSNIHPRVSKQTINGIQTNTISANFVRGIKIQDIKSSLSFYVCLCNSHSLTNERPTRYIKMYSLNQRRKPRVAGVVREEEDSTSGSGIASSYQKQKPKH